MGAGGSAIKMVEVGMRRINAFREIAENLINMRDVRTRQDGLWRAASDCASRERLRFEPRRSSSHLQKRRTLSASLDPVLT